MKRLFIIMILGLICVFPVSAFATELNQNNTIDEGIATVLLEQLSNEERDMLYDKSLYKENVEIEDKLIIRVYDSLSVWSKCNLSLNEIISWAESKNRIKYIVLNEENTNIRKIDGKDGIYFVAINTMFSYKGAAFIEDIKKSNSKMEIMGEQCEILGVHCFDGVSSHYGFFAYYVTDKGVFVKYYEALNTQGTWFKESDFAKYGTAYYKYITSYEYNYDEEGNALNGGISFETYIEEIFGTEKDYGVYGTSQQPQTNQSVQNGQNGSCDNQSVQTNQIVSSVDSQSSQIGENIEKNKAHDNSAVVTIAIATVTIILVGTSVIIICKKRKR